MLIIPRRMTASFDPEAAAWIALIEAADGQSLEPAVKDAYNAFVTGSKADASLNPGVSNWTATEQLLLMRGPRTLTSALIPMKGTNPTNVGFVSGDYNRKLDLKGNYSKYLNLNRGPSNDGQNNMSGWVWISRAEPSNSNTKYFGAQDVIGGTSSARIMDNSGLPNVTANSTGFWSGPGTVYQTGFLGFSRNNSANFMVSWGGSEYQTTAASLSPLTIPYFLFTRNVGGTSSQPTSAGIAACGSGKAVDLALMRSRINTLMTALAAAIP